MNVLSLFDGISCGQIALRRAGIEYNNYFASEIDKYAIRITQKNYPDTVQLGDIHNIEIGNLPKIDLLLGGSPCQSLSRAKRQKESGLKTGQSVLFWEYLRILNAVKPRYFLFENVASMKKTDRDIISNSLGIEPILINSALLTAQQRKRYYWTNIKGIEQPKDKEICLKGILEDGHTEKLKSYCITATYSQACPQDYFFHGQRQLIFNKPVRVGTIGNGGQAERIYHIGGKSICLGANGGGGGVKTGLYEIKEHVRRLTPIECERLQTVPDNYTKFGNHQMFLYIKQEIENGRIICKEKNVRLEDVIEKRQHINMANYVLCTIKDTKDMEAIMTQKENFKPIRNANIVIEKLERKVVEHEECVIDITKIGCDMETLYTQIKNEILLNPEVIMEGLMVKTDTGLLWKIFLGEVLKKQSVSTISILISWIIQSRICTYVKIKANILFSIENLSVLQGNLLKWKLSNLRMESIELMSDTQRYKLLGNGFTVDVVVHILKYLK